MARTKRTTKIVDLQSARRTAHRKQIKARLDRVIEGNRRALSRLVHSGLIWTRQGTRAGRDLLLAHQHLLRVSDLIQRMEKTPAASRAGEARVYEELEVLLAKSDQLATRTDEFVASLR